MTVSYSDNFVKLLFRWQGSLWKSIWLELLLFLSAYYVINIVYRVVLEPEQQDFFKKLIVFCDNATAYIPLLFLLGFYVYMIVGRWWDQFMWVSWPDRFMIFVTTYIYGDANELRLIRRTISRWCTLLSILAWRQISVRIMKRFPTLDHIVKAGIFTEEEKQLYESTHSPYGKYWLPCIWIANLLKQCQLKGLIDLVELKQLMREMQTFRAGFGMLLCYDWISVPLVYTQVVTIATYGYFMICLIGRQQPNEKDLDTYFPIFTVLQFLFYMGWLKVGEDLMNPFGEDDDDFEMNWILDRNFQISLMIADDVHGQLPPIVPDAYWGDSNPCLPHTRASLKHKDTVFEGHLSDYTLTEEEMVLVLPGAADEAEQQQSANPIVRFRNLVRTAGSRQESDAESGQPSSGASSGRKGIATENSATDFNRNNAELKPLTARLGEDDRYIDDQ